MQAAAYHFQIGESTHEDSFFGHRGAMQTFDIKYEDRISKFHFYLGSVHDTKNNIQGRGKEPDDDEPEEVRVARELAEEAEALKPDYIGYIRYYRLNVDFKRMAFDPKISFIYRDLKFYVEENQFQENELTYKSSSFTTSIYSSFHLDDDINVVAYASVESVDNKAGISYYESKSSKIYPKMGINWSLTF